MGIDGTKIQLAYEEAEITGVSFSVLEYTKSNYPNIDLGVIKKAYSERAKSVKDSLLESGAIKFINFLRSTDRNFCIMSYGEKTWQNLKILSTGIVDIPILIVSSHKKGSLIANWLDASSRRYFIPKKCFLDNKSRVANEIILIDDKIRAFDNLPDSARGYLVTRSINRSQFIRKVPTRVEVVDSVDEIISLEVQRFRK